MKEGECVDRTTGRTQTDRETESHAASRDREEAIWPKFNNALVCHTWTEFVGQISMRGQRSCKRGRRERQRCAGQIDRLLFITQASLHMGMKDSGGKRGREGRKVEKKKNEAGRLSCSEFHFQYTLLLQLTLRQRLDFKQINKTISGESLRVAAPP